MPFLYALSFLGENSIDFLWFNIPQNMDLGSTHTNYNESHDSLPCCFAEFLLLKKVNLRQCRTSGER